MKETPGPVTRACARRPPFPPPASDRRRWGPTHAIARSGRDARQPAATQDRARALRSATRGARARVWWRA
eukprot:751816-Pleurochrysis_carterae.AAC.1